MHRIKSSHIVVQKYATPSSVINMSLQCVAIKYSAWQFRFQSGWLKSKICTDVPKIWINHADYKNNYVKQTSKNLLKSLVKDLNTNLIIFGEANLRSRLPILQFVKAGRVLSRHILKNWAKKIPDHFLMMSKKNASTFAIRMDKS